MTKEEFSKEYERLRAEFPEHYQSLTRKELIAKRVIHESHSWWIKFVDRSILSHNPRIDVEDALRAERLARTNRHAAIEAIGAYDSILEQISDRGLPNVLEKFGTSDLWDAVVKNKETRR